MVASTPIHQRPSLLTYPRGIAVIILAIIVIWAVMQWNLSGMVFLGVAVLFLIGLKQPLWAIAAILISQMTITSYMITTPFVEISLRLLLMVITLLILRGALVRKEVDLGPYSRRLIIPTVVILVLTFIANQVNGLDFDIVFKNLRSIIVALLFMILIPAVIDTVRQLKTISAVVLIIATASSIIAIFQHFNVLGMSQATLIPDFLTETVRVPGMGETELELSYILPAVILAVITIFFTKGIDSRYRITLWLPVVPMLLGLYLTYTRSALFAIGCGLLALILFMRTKIPWVIIPVIMVIFILLIQMTGVLEGSYLGGRSEEAQDESSIARSILWQAGVAIALDNPIFGIGAEQFIKVSPSYAPRVDPYLIEWEGDRYYSYTTLGNDDPHNDFLMVWLSYGTPAVIVFIVFHFLLAATLGYAYHNAHSRFLRGFTVGLAAAFITYIINSMYHNTLATLPLLWILAGFALAVAKLANKEKTMF